MSSASRGLRLVVVTPERTVLDEAVQSVVFPLQDGQMGVLPGRAPLVGRLGYGPLRYTTSAGEQSLFIEAGFVQVRGGVVSILTEKASALAQLDPAAARDQLQAALKKVPRSELEFALRDREQARARGAMRAARS